jgi:hypothetical protein
MNPAAVLQSYTEYETIVLTIKLRGRSYHFDEDI